MLNPKRRQALIGAALIVFGLVSLVILWTWNTGNDEIGIAMFNGNLPPIPTESLDDEAVELHTADGRELDMQPVTTGIYIPEAEEPGTPGPATSTRRIMEWDPAWNDRRKWPKESARWTSTVSNGWFSLQTR